MRIALVTDRARRALTHDDAPLVAAFAALGDEAVPVEWADPEVAWGSFAAIAIRSPWDYHERWPDFSAWLDRVAELPLWNPARVLRWNLTKTYLLELQEAGLPVIPSIRLAPGAAPDLGEAIARWGEVVVKPEVGAGGAFTLRADRGSRAAVERAIAARRSEGVGFLVQPFLPAVFAGEWSLVWIDGEYSHAVRKTGAEGNFLVHEEHGGRVDPAVAPPALVAIGERFARFLPDLPYARVDLIGEGADARLVELELVEPELFFRFGPGSADRFARAIHRRAADRAGAPSRLDKRVPPA